jgi:hypothetical protein
MEMAIPAIIEKSKARRGATAPATRFSVCARTMAEVDKSALRLWTGKRNATTNVHRSNGLPPDSRHDLGGRGKSLALRWVTQPLRQPSQFRHMTRRTAVLLGLALPALASPPDEFWNEKAPKDWTEDERKQLLTNSPWAREATTKYNLGAYGLGMMGVGGTGRRGGRTTANPGAASDNRDAPPLPKRYDSVVRWESALPVREAKRAKPPDDAASNYILCVTGNLPMLGRASDDESDDEYSQRLDMLKEQTKLEKKGDPIYLDHVAYSKDGALFYFERGELTLHDGSVTFVTTLGPLDVKCKFALKEMMYRGKLEL